MLPGTMFARYYVEIPQPFEEVEEVLLDAPERWIPGLAEGAKARGELLLAEVGFGAPGHRIEKQVSITIGEAFRYPAKTLVPMSWEATGAQNLFPSLDADIEVARLGPGRTQLSISARYRPPLGRVGRAVDRAMLHRVAEATLKDFLDRVAERFPTPVPS